jgi:hypothetical protein
MADSTSLLLLFSSKLGLSSQDVVVQKALKSIEKNIPLSHVLAEVLLYSYLRDKGYKFISIEETIGLIKCDVYIEGGELNMCIEVETLAVPIEYILEGLDYVIARHVKKVIQIAKSGIKIVSFAYPFGVIPLIPLEFLKNPKDRDIEKLLKLLNTARKFFPLDLNDVAYLRLCNIEEVYVYDLASLNVKPLSKEKVFDLVNLYTNIFLNRISIS